VRGLRALGAISALLVFDTGAGAQSACQSAFERWAKLSEARVRIQKPASDSSNKLQPSGQACAPTEAVRQGLLNALTRARAKCDEASLDALAQATKTMLDINEGFIRSLPLCRAEATSGWVTKAAPAPAPAHPPASARPNAGPSRQCLEVSRVAPERFTLSNRWCGGSTVLAIVETRGSAGVVECRAHAIGQSMTVHSRDTAPPQINHECLFNEGRCTKDHLGSMFPECDW
jgi:hypothetical protein